MAPSALSQAFAAHPRQWQDFQFVYPVISRRSRGLSIGINLSPGKACNFNCVYCSVNRSNGQEPLRTHLDQLRRELKAILAAVQRGTIWEHPRLRRVPAEYRRLRDIAFSGDGEPTMFGRFDAACRIAASMKQAFNLHQTKLVLITNATRLHQPRVLAGLTILDANHGEVWAKLDAGTEPYFQRINRSSVHLETILNNILNVGAHRPIVIQTMVLRLDGQPMPPGEFDVYLQRLRELRQQGCRIKMVQLYTVARSPGEESVAAADDKTLAAYAQKLRHALPEVAGEVFGAKG